MKNNSDDVSFLNSVVPAEIRAREHEEHRPCPRSNAIHVSYNSHYSIFILFTLFTLMLNQFLVNDQQSHCTNSKCNVTIQCKCELIIPPLVVLPSFQAIATDSMYLYISCQVWPRQGAQEREKRGVFCSFFGCRNTGNLAFRPASGCVCGPTSRDLATGMFV